MMIDKKNIELKIFEYHEGLLDNAQQQELLNFIRKNQEYQVDFDAMGKSFLPDEELEYKHVDDLLVDTNTKTSRAWGWSIGGALFLLSFVSFAWYQKFNNENMEQIVASQQSKIQQTEKVNKSAANAAESNPGNEQKSAKKSIVNFLKGDKAAKNNAGNSVLNNNPFISDNKKGTLVLEDLNSSGNHKAFSAASNAGSKPTSNGNNNSVGGGKNVGINSNASNVSDNSAPAVVTDINKQTQEKSIASKFSKIFYANKMISNFVPTNKNQLKRKRVGKLPDVKDPKVRFSNDLDPFYANEEGTNLTLNPSFAGNTDGVRLEYYYRTEWPSINRGNYVTQLITIDKYIDAIKGGVGIIYEDDVIGHNKFNTRSFGVFYSPKIKASGDWSIEPSVRYMNTRKSVQWNQVSSPNLVDPRTGFKHLTVNTDGDQISSTSISYNSIGLGMLINHKHFYLGASYDRLNNVTYDFQQLSSEIELPASISFQSGTEIKAHKDALWTFIPSVNYFKFGDWERLWLNNQVKYKKFMIGAGIAHNKGYVFNAGYASKLVRLIYSYGLTQPPVGSDVYFGSHQITMRVNFLPVK